MQAAEGRAIGAGAGGEGNSQSSVRASGGEKAPWQAKNTWVDNVRQDATSLGISDWESSATDRDGWKAFVEVVVRFQTLWSERSKRE